MAQTTFEHIESHALREPRRLAMVEGQHHWDYAELHASLVRLTRVLDEVGVRRGQWVAVSCPSFSLQLMLLIACENVGAVSVPFIGVGDPEQETVLAMADWVLSEVPQPLRDPGRFQLADAAFVARVEATAVDDGTPYPRISLEPQEPQRVARTSGSTGRARFMVMTHAVLDWWLSAEPSGPECSPDARILVAFPLVVNSGYLRACRALRSGGAVLAAMSFARAIELGMNGFTGLPVQLEKFLGELPPGLVAPRPVTIYSVGGFLRDEVRHRAKRVLGGAVISRYGSNEVGAVSLDLDADGTGVLREGVEVRIVDEGGTRLAAGSLGMIEVRSPGMVAGYLNAPEATAASFRDGWFRTGDLGQLVAPRRLRVVGRYDDLIIIGGVKYPATTIEASVRRAPGVRDVAVLAINLAQGAVTLGVAVELEEGTKPEDMDPRIAKVLPLDAGTRAQVVYMPKLPRTAVGKIDRAAIHRLLQNAVS